MSYVGNTPTQQAFTPAIDYFSGNGSTVAFTLSRPVASVAQVQVVVNNVPQNPSTAFTVLNNTITFTGAPSSGTNNIYVEYTSPITQVVQPGQGTVGTTQLVDGSITTAKLASSFITPEANGGTGTTTGYYGFKNRIINGAMAIDQRNAGALITVVSNMYTLDRFFAYRGGFAAGMQVQRVAGFLGKQYAARLQRASGNTSTAAITYAQVFESANVLDLAGNSVTVSFDVRTGANYSGGQLTVELDTGTALDQTSAQLLAGSWTGIATQTSAVSISSTATRYSATFTVPSGMQSMATQFYWTPTGTAGAADYVEITGVQLEKGSTATSFDYRPYGTELALCQRYFQKSYDTDTVVGSTSTNGLLTLTVGTFSTSEYCSVFLKTSMRAQPSISYYSQGGTLGTIDVYTTSTNTTTTSISTTNAGNNSFRLQIVRTGDTLTNFHFIASAEL